MTKRFLMPFANHFGANLDQNQNQNLGLRPVDLEQRSPRSPRALFKGLAQGCIGVLACLSLAAIRVPIAQAQSTSLSDDEVSRYAKAVLAIEGKRRQIYADAKGLPEWNTVSQQAAAKGVNVCDLSQAELPGNIFSLCQQLFKTSKPKYRGMGLTTPP
jgi:hypothetical protein